MKIYNLITLSVFLVTSLRAEPYLSPNDPFIRNEIRLLGDEGELTGLQNTWPLDLGGLSAMRAEQSSSLPHNLLDGKISQESGSGFSPIFMTLGISGDRVTARGFSPEPRSSFATNASVSWMNDRFAGKLSLNAFYGMETDWKGRKDEGFALDGSYIAARLGNWSASFGQVERWWGPGWDGSLILSTNARPIPAISIDRRVPEPLETKWLSWLGPWSFHSFIGQLEKERPVPNPYIWAMRGEVKPTIIRGLEIGFFRVMQLGGDGYPSHLSVWVDALLSQDNLASTDPKKSEEPGNQLAGLDVRFKPLDHSVAFYLQVAGEDEDNFLPNALFFQYGIETWKILGRSTVRIFAEYADLTSYYWTGDPRTRSITYSHGRYKDGYRYKGRSIGHWADQDSRIYSFGGLMQNLDNIGWGSTIRIGDLNAEPNDNFPYDRDTGLNSLSNGKKTKYFSAEIFNSRKYTQYNMSVFSSVGYESLEPTGGTKNDGFTAFLSLTRIF